jgi:hypothetical protein
MVNRNNNLKNEQHIILVEILDVFVRGIFPQEDGQRPDSQSGSMQLG